MGPPWPVSLLKRPLAGQTPVSPHFRRFRPPQKIFNPKFHNIDN
jgi:hypothetical protein